ncbi:MAG: response regulator [Kiloniellaceae bacterium]
MRVLQVEDDVATARAVEQMLQSKGYSCRTTSLGEEAVDLATRNDYDVILLDICLPDIDGYEVLRRLQAAQVRAPVVVQSGLVGRDEMEKGAGFGVEDYLIKPFTKRELTDRIETALQRPSAQAELARPPVKDSSDRRNAPRRDGSGRRQHARVKTLKSGQVIYQNANCVTDCLILNLSDGGAAIQLVDFIRLPETFLLKAQYGPMYRCEVCWRHGNKLGVRFVNPAAHT